MIAWRGQKVPLSLTLISVRAASSFCWLRAMMITFAPLAASWLAALRPMPSDPPVMRMVCCAHVSRVPLITGFNGQHAYLALDGHLIFSEETHDDGSEDSYQTSRCYRRLRRTHGSYVVHLSSLRGCRTEMMSTHFHSN